MTDFSSTQTLQGGKYPQPIRPPLMTTTNQSTLFHKHNGTLKTSEQGMSQRHLVLVLIGISHRDTSFSF